MPLKEDYIKFDEEIERLKAEREELVESVASLGNDHPQAGEFTERGKNIDGYLQGVRWARDDAADDENVPAWSEDVDGVTLAGLAGGEFGQVEDAVVSDTLARGEDRVGKGSLRVYNVAKGTVDAPYLTDDMDFDTRIAAASSLPITFLKWANNRIDSMTTVGNAGETSFAALLAEKQASQTETSSGRTPDQS